MEVRTPISSGVTDRAAAVFNGQVTLTVALAGQPNVGKSTVFNLLTGLSQHVGNWPGKTVEQKVGTHRHGDTTMHIVDLPGTYSLTANSQEERITRDYIIKERPDVVVAIADHYSHRRVQAMCAEGVSEYVFLGRATGVGTRTVDSREMDAEPRCGDNPLGNVLPLRGGDVK